MARGCVLSRFAAPSIVQRSKGVIVEIGGIAILLETEDADFRELLEQRYSGFVNPSATPTGQLAVHLDLPLRRSEEDARVFRSGSAWRIERGDFRAVWDARSRRGWVRQSPNPYSIDSVLRIVHTLALAEEGGFLLHAASAVRQGRAYVFAGVSGAGKTTIARLAPPDATVLTDEVSYIRRRGAGFEAYGTPFAGELARVGANLAAPLAAVYFLEKGPRNRVEPAGPLAAARALLRHILFFAHDASLVQRVFQSAVELVSTVPARQLVFTPGRQAWELIP